MPSQACFRHIEATIPTGVTHGDRVIRGDSEIKFEHSVI